MMCAVSQWSEKWLGAEVIYLLSPSKKITQEANTRGTEVHKLLQKYQEKHQYKLSPQWNDNYICPDVSNG